MKYNVITVSENELYTIDSVVQLLRYQIVFDNELNQTLARMVFGCSGDKIPSEIAFDIKCFDIANSFLSTIENKTLYVTVGNDKTFGKEKSFIVPDGTKKIEIEITNIIFTDGTFQQINAPILKKSNKSSAFINGEDGQLIRQLLEKESYKTNCDFENFDQYWQCTCGQMNSGEVCVLCGADKGDLTTIFDKNTIDDYRIKSKYNKASSIIQTSNSESELKKALDILSQISDYKDSAEKIDYCNQRIVAIKEKREAAELEAKEKREAAEREAAERKAAKQEHKKQAEQKIKKGVKKTVKAILITVGVIIGLFIILAVLAAIGVLK